MPKISDNWTASILKSVIPVLVVALCGAAVKIYVDVSNMKSNWISMERIVKLEARAESQDKDIASLKEQVKAQWRRRNPEVPPP